MKYIKKLFSVFLSMLIVMTIIPLRSFAASGTSGSGKCGANLTWSYSNGTLTISGSGDMYNYQAGDSHWTDGIYNYTAIQKLVINEGVTSIGYAAFYNSKYLQSIELPSSLNSIADQAFAGCDKITKLSIKNIDSWCEINFYGINSNPLNYSKNLYINNVLATDVFGKMELVQKVPKM